MPSLDSIVLELQREALDRKCSVSDLLRRAMVVAQKLKLTEFEKWIGNELEGYNGAASEVPAYRRVLGQVKVNNPYRGWMPMTFEDPEEAELLSSRLCGQSVAELEHLLSGKKTSSALLMSFPPDLERDLMKSMNPVALKPFLQVSASSVFGILDAVRTSVLKWALRLETDGILAACGQCPAVT